MNFIEIEVNHSWQKRKEIALISVNYHRGAQYATIEKLHVEGAKRILRFVAYSDNKS